MNLKPVIAAVLASACFTGCAHVFSEEILKDVNQDISFVHLKVDPEVHRGKSVLLGGVIVKAVIREDDTQLEIYETELDDRGKPINLDRSRGRFLAYHDGFLESEIYCQGRRVTLVGTVMGSEVRTLDQTEYLYACIAVEHLHLWKPEPAVMYVDPFYHDCWWWPHYGYVRYWPHHRWYPYGCNP